MCSRPIPLGWRPRRPVTGKWKSRIEWHVPTTARQSRRAAASAKNGLDQLFGRVGGGRRIVRDRMRGLTQLNGLSITVEVCDAPGALGEMPVKLRALLGRQVAEQILVQELGEFAAVHTWPRRKCGSSSARRAWRTRCSRD